MILQTCQWNYNTSYIYFLAEHNINIVFFIYDLLNRSRNFLSGHERTEGIFSWTTILKLNTHGVISLVWLHYWSFLQEFITHGVISLVWLYYWSFLQEFITHGVVYCPFSDQNWLLVRSNFSLVWMHDSSFLTKLSNYMNGVGPNQPKI